MHKNACFVYGKSIKGRIYRNEVVWFMLSIIRQLLQKGLFGLVIKKINNEKYVYIRAIETEYNITPLYKHGFEEDHDERHIKNAYYWINRQVIEYKEWLDNLIDNYEEIKNRISAEQMRSDNKWFKKSILDTLNDLHNLKSEYIWEI